MRLSQLSWVLSLVFIIGACSVYQSDGRKFLQNNAMTYASYPFQIEAFCTENQRLPWALKWFDGELALQQAPQDPQTWFMSWPPQPGGCMVQIKSQGLSEEEQLTGLIELARASQLKKTRP